jgi:hypothetical protein
MKKAISVLIMSYFSLLLIGQAPFPSKDEIQQFSESKTFVVLEDDPLSDFNFYIKDAMEEYWKITPYDFMNVSDFNVRRISSSNSFIVLTETNYDKDKSNSVFNFINLLLGKDVDKLGEMPEICAIPLSFVGEEEDEYGYKLGAILSFMQKHAQLIMEDPSKTGRKYLKYYNENIAEKIRAIYSNKVEIVTEEEIINAIENKTPNTLILHKVAPVRDNVREGYCFKMLIGTDDANMYYYDLHSIDKKHPNGFLASDLKRLARFD